MQQQRNILVTSALPYANGPLHMGHMVEYIQSDIWVRFQKMRGHNCFSICADDAHGTAISLYAQSAGVSPEQLIEQIHEQRLKDFTDFNIHFDNYHTTHSEENRKLVESIYDRLKKKGHIITKTITQAYDTEKQMFLADRYIKGQCPKCGEKDQYGDNCDKCGSTYAATDLINAYSTISGTTPVEKESEHFFFKLEDFHDILKSWVSSNSVPKETSNKLREWLDDKLLDWDISRDSPYFGFQIPDTTDKYFYVWLDAPIGYMASFKSLCDKKEGSLTPDDFDRYWAPASDCELHHFIGKDIVNFHCLFWPAMLMGANYRLPDKVHIHGYLTVNGSKMSKSRGTFITARQYLDNLDSDYLRYYYATKLSSRIDDIDLDLDDLSQKINSDLVGKLVNIASRCSGFIKNNFNNTLAETILDTKHQKLLTHFISESVPIADLYENLEYNKAIRAIMKLADKANSWIDQEKPWFIAKNEPQSELLRQICSVGINLFKIIMVYINPVLPSLSEKAANFLNISKIKWQDHQTLLLNHKLNNFKPLLSRIHPKQIAALMASSTKDVKQHILETQQNTDDEPNKWLSLEPVSEEITYDDFIKVDLRIALISNAEHVPKAKKLLKLELDIGGELRTIFAGIKSAYEPEHLIGKLTVVVANLAPRKMKFGLSEGMVLAAGPGGKDIWILEANPNTQPGMRIT